MDTLKKNYNSENFILLCRTYEQEETIDFIVSIYKNNHLDFLKVNETHSYLNYAIQNHLKKISLS
ncbi:hypothetical protein [Catenibacterium mitsuokai]|uniref:hypothetical protein n=1 Tax=Catenibacterium mitsuokai TaxID=100886 RepID=UPI0022E32285|nr:hypothetical protein [Catenibacterium mitsuokai]